MPGAEQPQRIDTASLLVRASPGVVFSAFDASALMSWLPPRGMTGRVLEYDFRDGGRYRLELTYADAASPAAKTTAGTDVTTGRFLDVRPPRRIRQSVEFLSGDPAFAGEMIMTWTFEPEEGGTRVRVTVENVPRNKQGRP